MSNSLPPPPAAPEEASKDSRVGELLPEEQETGQASPTLSKPRTEFYRPELTRLPQLTFRRRLFRRLLNSLCRLAVLVCTRCQVTGLENFPGQGPALVVTNHLGDADVVMGMAFFPRQLDALAKIDLYKFPIAGWIMETYGVIWIHRGQPDRKAIREALKGLKQGRLIGIAPEGRESVTGGLEEGTGGAAFLALKGDVPLVPVTFTGTENQKIYNCLKRLHRAPVTLTAGPAFHLEHLPDRRQALDAGTDLIMRILAGQLPPEYRGIYQDEVGPGAETNRTAQ